MQEDCTHSKKTLLSNPSDVTEASKLAKEIQLTTISSKVKL